MKPNATGERLEEYALNVITLEHLHRYAIAREFIKNKRVLDIACGEGYGSFLLSEMSATVTGIDINSKTIENAKLKYRKNNLTYLVGNAENIPAQHAEFDVVVSFETLEHIYKHDKMLSELKRVLKPGGLLIISTPDKLIYNDNANHKNPFHLKELYREEFEQLIQGYFKNSLFLYQKSGLLSIVIPQAGTGIPISYTGNMTQIMSENSFGAPFLIAIACDDELPALSPSVFSSASLLREILKDQQALIKESISYRLGHLLLLPFKFTSALFKRIKSK